MLDDTFACDQNFTPLFWTILFYWVITNTAISTLFLATCFLAALQRRRGGEVEIGEITVVEPPRPSITSEDSHVDSLASVDIQMRADFGDKYVDIPQVNIVQPKCTRTYLLSQNPRSI